MASPQVENGYTRIANEILEKLTKVELNGTQFALILAIMRKTYGFNKKEDAISIDQFVEMLRVSRRTVIYTLQELEAKNIIFVRRSRNSEKNNTNIVRFNKDYDAWVIFASATQVEKNRSSAKLRKQNLSSAKPDTLVVQNHEEEVQSFAPTKETIQKTTKEISKTDVLQGQQWNELIDSFAEINPMYEDIYKNKTERNALQALVDNMGYEKLLNTLKALPSIVSLPYAPRITKPSELKRDLGKLVIFYKQEQGKIKSNNVLDI